ncbi:reverse transcriptase domain-containing protein [Tanacetum coccineum]
MLNIRYFNQIHFYDEVPERSEYVDLKGITTRSGVAYQGPTIPTNTTTSPPKVVERETEVTKDTVPPTNNKSTKDVQPPVVQLHIPNSEPVVTPVSALMPNLKPSIPYPSRHNDERSREKANDQIEKFYEIFKDLSFEISLTDALILMLKFGSTLKALIGNKEKLNLTPTCITLELADRSITQPIGIAEDVYLKVGKFKFPADFVVVDFDADPRVPLILGRSFLSDRKYSSNYDEMTANRIDVIEMACEEYSQEVLGISDVIARAIPILTMTDRLTLLRLNPFEDSVLLLKEVFGIPRS